MPEKLKRKMPLTSWRRLAQALFLVLFLFLFRKTDYAGTDEIPYAVNIFFRWDPLVAASAMLAAKAFIRLLIPSFIVIAMTLLLGRFFCGWVCPLGTCLDVAHKIIPPKSAGERRYYRSYKYYILTIVLVAAIFGVSLVGYFDPFSILTRGLAIAVDPALNVIVRYPFEFVYQQGPQWLNAMAQPIFGLLKKTVLPFNQSVFTMALPTTLILALVFAFERIERRFWCRNLCPLGGLLALFSRIAPLRLQPGKACKSQDCTTCIDICRMRAIDDEGLVSPEACNLCMDCMEKCPKGIIGFNFKRPKHDHAPMGISRRAFGTSVAAGLVLPAVLKVRAIGKKPDPFLIRPPGALEEGEFLSRCVRCGECMKVCIGNALQPTAFEAGFEGMFSPVVIPRIGYCEYNCTLCGQVCPTGAIKRLPKNEKQQVKIGLAWFDKNRCLPWAKGIPCIVCEEMCPTPDKAIKFREGKVANPLGEEVIVKMPYVIDDLCIGCGVCENKCPLPGFAAVRVTNEGESRNPENLP